MPTQNETARTVREEAKRRGVTLSYMYHLVWAGKVDAVKGDDGRWLIPVRKDSALTAANA